MKTTYKLEIRDTSGRLHRVKDYPINTHELMKDQDVCEYILSLPYVCTEKSDYSKTIVPIGSIASLKVTESE